MKLFEPIFDRVLSWSKHPHAPWYLGGLSFAESSFFPVPPDVMLAPMVVARPEQAWRLATITTVCSVVGGLAGFALGIWALDMLMPLIQEWGYGDAYLQATDWFERWGFWAIFAAGFSPIPYKIFTITAGALAMPLAPFALASMVGRGMRFFLVSGLLYWGGERVERSLRKNVEMLGWLAVALLVLVYFALR